MSKRNATIGAAVGFGGAALCIALALLMHAIHPYLPAMREFLLWAMAPQFAMGMCAGASLFAVGVVLISWGDDHV
jgi:hypothetical protein